MNDLAYELLLAVHRHTTDNPDLGGLHVKIMGEDGQVYGHHYKPLKLILDIEEGCTHIDLLSTHGVTTIPVESIHWFKVHRGGRGS